MSDQTSKTPASPASPQDAQAAPTPDAKAPLTLMLLSATLALLPGLFVTGFTSYESVKRFGLVMMTSLCLMVWGIAIARKRRVQVVAMRAFLPLLSLGVLAPLSLLWSSSPRVGLWDAIYWSSLVAFGACVLGVEATRGQLVRWLLPAISLGTGVAGLTGLLDRAGVKLFTLVWNPEGATGAFDAMEFAAAYEVIALPLCLAALLGLRDVKLRALGGFGLIFGGLHLGMVAPQWAWISFGVSSVAALAMLFALARARGKALVSFAGALLVVGALMGVGYAVRGDLETEAPESTSLPVVDAMTRRVTLDTKLARTPRNPRFAFDRIESLPQGQADDYLYGLTLELANQQLPIGLGAGGWWLAQPPANPTPAPFLLDKFDHYPVFKSPHNGFARVLVDFGLLGLVLFGGWILAALSLGARGILALDAESDFERQDARLILCAAWGSALAGVLAMWWSAALELPEAAVVWITAMTLALRLISMSGEVKSVASGWVSPWGLDQRQRGATALVAASLMAMSVAALIPTGLNLVAHYHRGQADQFMLRSRNEDARAAYLRAFNTYPAQGLDLYNAALAAYRTGNITKMQEELEQAIALNPHDARVLGLAAMIDLRKRRFKQAASRSREAILRYPTFIEAYRILASAQNLSSEFEDASKTLLKAIALKPPVAVRGQLHYELAQLYEGPLGLAPQAVEHYDLAVKYLEPGFLHERSSRQAAELRRRVERERLMREGKPIPPGLMPKEDDHGHDHDGHSHDQDIFPGGGERFKELLEQRDKKNRGELSPEGPLAPDAPKQ